MENIGLSIKNANVYKGLVTRKTHPTLVEIEEYLINEYGGVMTESYRPPRHANDVHSTDPVRAHDWRHWAYPKGVAEQIANDINGKWQYDPARPQMVCMLIHNSGNGVHMHLQVSGKTIRRV